MLWSPRTLESNGKGLSVLAFQAMRFKSFRYACTKNLLPFKWYILVLKNIMKLISWAFSGKEGKDNRKGVFEVICPVHRMPGRVRWHAMGSCKLLT